jgi:hypothetical protein
MSLTVGDREGAVADALRAPGHGFRSGDAEALPGRWWASAADAIGIILVTDAVVQLLAVRRIIDHNGSALSQAMISLDWPGMAAREYASAAELAGERTEGDWSAPPAAAQDGGAK